MYCVQQKDGPVPSFIKIVIADTRIITDLNSGGCQHLRGSGVSGFKERINKITYFLNSVQNAFQ